LIVQQNYFFDPAKILDLSAEPFFPCTATGAIRGQKVVDPVEL